MVSCAATVADWLSSPCSGRGTSGGVFGVPDEAEDASDLLFVPLTRVGPPRSRGARLHCRAVCFDVPSALQTLRKRGRRERVTSQKALQHTQKTRTGELQRAAVKGHGLPY